LKVFLRIRDQRSSGYSLPCPQRILLATHGRERLSPVQAAEPDRRQRDRANLWPDRNNSRRSRIGAGGGGLDSAFFAAAFLAGILSMTVGVTAPGDLATALDRPALSVERVGWIGLALQG